MKKTLLYLSFALLAWPTASLLGLSAKEKEITTQYLKKIIPSESTLQDTFNQAVRKMVEGSKYSDVTSSIIRYLDNSSKAEQITSLDYNIEDDYKLSKQLSPSVAACYTSAYMIVNAIRNKYLSLAQRAKAKVFQLVKEALNQEGRLNSIEDLDQRVTNLITKTGIEINLPTPFELLEQAAYSLIDVIAAKRNCDRALNELQAVKAEEIDVFLDELEEGLEEQTSSVDTSTQSHWGSKKVEFKKLSLK
jgi:hypothetical protein